MQLFSSRRTRSALSPRLLADLTQGQRRPVDAEAQAEDLRLAHGQHGNGLAKDLREVAAGDRRLLFQVIVRWQALEGLAAEVVGVGRIDHLHPGHIDVHGGGDLALRGGPAAVGTGQALARLQDLDISSTDADRIWNIEWVAVRSRCRR